MPGHFLVQVQTHLRVLGMSMSHVAVLVGGNDYRAPYVVEADRAIQELNLEKCEEFHARCLIGDDAPELTGTNVEEHLKRKYASHHDLMIAVAPNVDAIVAELAKVKRDSDDAEAREKKLKAQLMAFIGVNNGVISKHGCIPWSETKGRESIDTKGHVTHLNVPPDVLQSSPKCAPHFARSATRWRSDYVTPQLSPCTAVA